MEQFIKAIAVVLIALILCLCLSQRGKETAILLSLFVCCMVVIAAFTYLRPVLSFFTKLHELIGLDSELLSALLKAVGVAILSEIASMICMDSGQAALAKAVQILSSAVILWISLPLFTQVLSLVEEILKTI